MASVWRVQSYKDTLTPLMCSSVKTPSLVTHYQADSQESLISFMYWTPLVASTKQLGPLFSGPKDHNLAAARSLSQPNSSNKYLALVLGSSLGPNFPSSHYSAKPSSKGEALAEILLCLLGDLDIHI